MDVCYNKYTSKILFYRLLTSVFVTLLRSITNSRKLYPVILLTARVVISGNRDGTTAHRKRLICWSLLYSLVRVPIPAKKGHGCQKRVIYIDARCEVITTTKEVNHIC